MKKLLSFHFLLSFFLTVAMMFFACGTKKNSSGTPNTTASSLSDESSLPLLTHSLLRGNSKMVRPIIIYATRADYATLVPITLDASGSFVVSYPSRSDLRHEEGFTTPIVLKEGYLYDRRGISPHTAFLSISYEYYSALAADPSPNWLLNFVLDKDPLTFLAICSREELLDESPSSLNSYIERGFPRARILVDKRNEP